MFIQSKKSILRKLIFNVEKYYISLKDYKNQLQT